MAIGEIDLTLPAINVELFLAKPNREIIGKLSEAYNKKMILKLGNINEITFTLPYEVSKNRKLIRNPHIDIVKERYLIKAVFAGKTEWYKIVTLVNTMNEGDSMDVTCYLLPYELSDKSIRIFEEDALNIYQVMNGGTIVDPDSGTNHSIEGILSETLWTLGYVDADIATKYRGYSFSSMTVLDCIFNIAETLNALLVWNTISKTVSFYNADNFGVNRGFTIHYGHYLKSLSRESKSDEMVTRLKVFGKDGMSIQSLNINGQNYLEDYSYFLYPFQRDSNHNVIKHSDFMSDSLCHAILDYTEYAESKQNQFSSLLSQKTPYETSLNTRKNELSTLVEEMAVINNNIDIYKSMNYDYTSLVTQKTSKQTQIDNKNTEIASINTSLASIDSQITTLKNSLKYSVFFTPQNLIELNDYIIYKDFSDESYIDEKVLYEDAKKQFDKYKEPQVILNMDIVNFLNIVEAQRDWDKLNLGDIVTIRYGKLNLNMEAKIIEITIDFESDNINLTIANTKDLMTDEEKLIKMIYANNSSSTLLDMKSTKWDGIDATASKVNQIIDNTWSTIKRGIEGGVNNTISINERGILVKNTSDPNKYLIIQNGVLAITGDNGNTWKHAITADGIVGERLYGKLLAGSNLVIDASDSNGTKTFTVDGTGVNILGTALRITGGITRDNLSEDFLNSIDTDIAEVNNAIDTLETNVNEILSDGMITSIEANSLKISLTQVTSESTDIISAATSLSIVAEKNAYVTSLTALTTELNKWIDKTYPMTISQASRTEIKDRFSDIQNKKSVLINKIAAIRQVLSQTYTDQEISEVNSALNTLDQYVDSFSSDLIITLAEANALKVSLNQVTSESSDLLSVANVLSIVAERTNYSTALTNLTTEINKWINKTYPLNILETDRTNIKTRFEALQNAKSILINKISAVRQALSNAYTDQEISDVNSTINTLDQYVDSFSSDLIITLAEANSLKVSLNQVNSESLNMISVATSLSIVAEKNNYSNALTALTTELNKWIDKTYPMNITSADRTNIKTKFETLQNTKSILINTITSVRQALSQSYTDGKVTTINAALGQLNTDIDQFSSDSVITLSEANSLKLSLNQVNSESTDLVNVANTLGITTEKTNYSNALTSLTTEINKWIDKTYPLTILSTDRTNIKTKFESLQSTKSILINKIASVREQRAKDASVGLGTAYNGVVIDATNGLVITKSDGTIRTILNATDGFSFEKKNGTSWDKKLYYSATTGNLVLDGELNAKSIKINGVELIAGNKLDGDMIDSIKVQQLDASTAKITTAMIETLTVGGNVNMGANATISWNQVTSKNLDYSVITGTKPASNADNTNENLSTSLGINYTKIGSTYVYTGTLKADQITAGKINANYIDVDSLRVDKLYRSNSAGSGYLTLSNSGVQSYGDLELWWSNSKWFSVYNVIGSAELRANDVGFLRSGGSNTYAYGSWDFSSATVTGVTAVFG